jgi:hypothetical protein
MLKFASCLSEGTSALVDPHVAVHFVPLGRWGARGDDAVDMVLEEWST